MAKTFSELCCGLKFFLLNPSFPLFFRRSQAGIMGCSLPLPTPASFYFIPYPLQALPSVNLWHTSFHLACASKRKRKEAGHNTFKSFYAWHTVLGFCRETEPGSLKTEEEQMFQTKSKEWKRSKKSSRSSLSLLGGGEGAAGVLLWCQPFYSF